MPFLTRGRRIPRDATFRNTQLGTDKLQEFKGDALSKVLMALETGGTLNVAEIAERSGISRGRVERLVPRLIQGSYIQPVSSSMVSEDE